MTTKQICREAITVLTPPARAFDRAKAKGFVVLDQQLGFVDLVGMPRPPKNPDQLRLEDAR